MYVPGLQREATLKNNLICLMKLSIKYQREDTQYGHVLSKGNLKFFPGHK